MMRRTLRKHLRKHPHHHHLIRRNEITFPPRNRTNSWYKRSAYFSCTYSLNLVMDILSLVLSGASRRRLGSVVYDCDMMVYQGRLLNKSLISVTRTFKVLLDANSS